MEDLDRIRTDLQTAAEAAQAGHWGALQQRMGEERLDALLLSNPGACSYAAGFERVTVMGGGTGIPQVVVPAEGPPHVFTTNPDGALGLAADRVHAQTWNLGQAFEDMARWSSEASAARRIGTDIVSPRAVQLMERAFPNAEIVDALSLVAGCLVHKNPAERRVLELMSRLTDLAARAGHQGVRRVIEILGGAVPAVHWTLSTQTTVIAASYRGFCGEARLGATASPAVDAAIDLLVAGRAAGEVAARIPAGVEVLGLGRGYEAPIIRNGSAWPADLVIPDGAVMVVRDARHAATVEVTAWGGRPLSPDREARSRALA
jgi:Creatinase/Prolidase N-terminal domain